MNVCIPPEVLPAIPLAVVVCLERISDIIKQHYSYDGKYTEVMFSGTSFESFTALRNAGCDPSWKGHDQGWSLWLSGPEPK